MLVGNYWEVKLLFQAGEQCLDIPLGKSHTYFRKGLPTYISSAQTQAILFGFDEK